MSITTEAARLGRLAGQLGQAKLHQQYPNEFEYYAMALELANSKGDQLAYLLLPILPDQITINSRPLSTITKSQGGLTKLANPTFNPEEISLNGSFGRRLRLLVRGGSVELSNALVSTGSGGTVGRGRNYQEALKNAKANLKNQSKGAKQVVGSFSYQARTGYGTCKLVEQMLRRSRQPDQFGAPHRLFFYNLAFNYHMLVEDAGFTFTQSVGRNRIWDYQLALRALAPAAAIQSATGTQAKTVLSLTADLVQRAATTAGRIAQDILQRGKNQAFALPTSPDLARLI